MANRKHLPLKVDTDRYFVLSPILPFFDIILQSMTITRREYSRIDSLPLEYHNDPRMIEMVRKGGDSSAKVPYLLDEGETADSILATLREIAQPHIECIQNLPDPVQATIHLLLSINTVPRGCELYGITALLEIDRIQMEIVHTLNGLMRGRQLAKEFHDNNIAALKMLDQDWSRLREEKSSRWATTPLPEKSQMQYEPFFSKADRLLYLHETCVIVDSPNAETLQRYTHPVLRSPHLENVPVPKTGSADWLIRTVGKIGRHFTRALLGIIKARLAEEKVALEAQDYKLINQEALDALREFVEKRP
jgi:hypothetical protein